MKITRLIHHLFKFVLIDWQELDLYFFGPYAGNPVPFETVVVELSKLSFDGIEGKKGRK